MPVFYPKKIRRQLADIDLNLLKKAIIEDGFKFVRDGGFRKDDKPFKFSNYLFYRNDETKTSIRVGYNYPLLGNNDVVFEICYATDDCSWWTDITPDCREKKWRKVMRKYNN